MSSENESHLSDRQRIKLAQNATNLIRVGILALPLAGLLTLVSLLGRYNTPDPRVDPELAARAATSSGFFVSQFVGTVIGLTLLIFGILALTAYLAKTRGRGLALAGMVLSIFVIALILSAAGVLAYALPVIGRAYLNGQQDVIGIVDAIFRGPAGKIFMPVFLLYSAGFILFGVAIWRSGVLPKVAAISVGLHAPLFAGYIRPQPSPTTIVGALLFILGSGMITLTVFRRPSAGVAEAEAEPQDDRKE
jgi:hypothetical protein